jgi:PQQ-dependent dehydrogenase (methanol/ethanol family)
MSRQLKHGTPVLLALATVLVTLLGGAAGSAQGAAAPSGDWLGFGRTPDNNRHSPLTAITPANVANLQRAYMVDFRRIDPDVRRGQQSYPLAIGGRLYVTTNDNNVFALEGATGKVLWQYKPTNSGLFKNFGIVANRGLAYCSGRLYMTTLDMKIVALRPSDGRVVDSVAISQAVQNASTHYGYSETSAPICGGNRILIGAAGSEYGVRGFVMAYNTDLTPAWPNPVWTIPPEQQGWRRSSRLVGGGAVWTPVTVDASTNTVFFGTGSGTPLYFPSMRPGTNPRTDSLIAVDLRNGKLKWWQQLIAGNQWAYDVAQPPLVYDGRIGGNTRRVVSVATMEGVWFAFDARTGRPIHQRVKVIDRIEHPSLKPGQPVTVFPSSLGGLNYSPASYDPTTNYIFNAAAETAAIMIQDKLTPTQKRRKLVLGDVYLGLRNGNFGSVLPDWKDHGSISAIDVASGRRVWKFETPEPERGGVTTTASGLGFAGGGDGVFRAFNLRTGRVLWTFRTGEPIASGATIFMDGGREYVAITVGGTPTSSNGGTVSQLHVFALPGGPNALTQTSRATEAGTAVARAAAPRNSAVVRSRTAAAGGARIVTGRATPLRNWNAATDNTQVVTGRLLLGGRPVSGAVVAVDQYRLAPTGADGSFSYALDVTLARRHLVHVVSAGRARVGGRALTANEQRTVRAATGGFSAGYRLTDLRARKQGDGTVLVTGRASFPNGTPPPPVGLYTYRLSGTITDANGNPVVGATVVTRTVDRDFWTFSQPTNSAGRYVSFFTGSDKEGTDPTLFNVQVAVGRDSYTSGFGRDIPFKRLRSATMDIKLPAGGPTAVLALPRSEPVAGAIYQGLLVGVSGPGGVIRPLSARWPDASGRFSLVLPRSAAGKTLRFWESTLQAFSTVAARPGGPVDVRTWPTGLSPRTARDVATVRAPR